VAGWYYTRVDAFIKALTWDDVAQRGEAEHVGTVAARLEWTPVDALVAALDAEAIGYAELLPPHGPRERRPEMYGIRLTEEGSRRLTSLRQPSIVSD
jgi:hypothetical protein